MIRLTANLNAQTRTPADGRARYPVGYTALHLAACGSDAAFRKAEIASSLIMARADMEIRSEGGCTPLLMACGSGLTDVAKCLIRNRADVHAIDHKGQGVLQKAFCSKELHAWLTKFTDAETTKGTSGRTREAKITQNRSLRYESRVKPRDPHTNADGSSVTLRENPENRQIEVQTAIKTSPPSLPPPHPFGKTLRRSVVGIFYIYFSSRGGFSFFPGGH